MRVKIKLLKLSGHNPSILEMWFVMSSKIASLYLLDKSIQFDLRIYFPKSIFIYKIFPYSLVLLEN